MQLTELEAHRHSIATRSGEISYIDVGTGPVALFVHGIATNAYLWRNVIGALSGPRRCIALDLPLHGRSPVTAGQDLSIAALAAGLEDFCDALVNIVGCSFIGFFATFTAPDGRVIVSTTARQFVMVGICGGYTTFSSFEWEGFGLIRDNLSLAGTIYLVGSVVVGLLAVRIGVALGRM